MSKSVVACGDEAAHIWKELSSPLLIIIRGTSRCSSGHDLGLTFLVDINEGIEDSLVCGFGLITLVSAIGVKGFIPLAV